jgi:hypothetical protein
VTKDFERLYVFLSREFPDPNKKASGSKEKDKGKTTVEIQSLMTFKINN